MLTIWVTGWYEVNGVMYRLVWG